VEPIFTGSEWNFDIIKRLWEEIDIIGKEMGLDYYPLQIEIVSAEQMLDAYSSTGLPSYYSHWSFGKSFVKNQKEYAEGKSGLAYELIINSNPSIAYLMESNSACMQATVLAHAGVGHSCVFKTNYLFKQWTDAEYIVDYMQFAKNYVADCEEKYGAEEVEWLLDACHSLDRYGVDKYKRPTKLKKELARQRERELQEYAEKTFNDLWRTVPDVNNERSIMSQIDSLFRDLRKEMEIELKEDNRDFPEENILYFIEKHSRSLKDWQKEIVRIVRKISQYFYPQLQTKLINEGMATFVEHEIMTRLYDKGLITEGSYIEFLKDHCNVINNYQMSAYQNPYALGFAMFADIKRIVTKPTPEDYEYFPDIAGTQDYMSVVIDIVKNYRDENFILQFLSPKVIRDFKFVSLIDKEDWNEYVVGETHDLEDYRAIKKLLSKQYDYYSYYFPLLAIVDTCPETGLLTLNHTVIEGRILDYKSAKEVVNYISMLWGGPVEILYVDEEGTEVSKTRTDDD
jgi:stage V sporulation protein R